MPLKIKNILIYFFLAVLIFAEFLLLKVDRSSDFLLPILIADLIFFLALAIYDANLCLNFVIMILPFKWVLFDYEIGIVTFDLYSGGIILLAVACLIKILLGQLSYKYVSLDITLIIFTVVCLSFFVTSSDITKSGYVYFHSVFIPALTYFVIRMLINSEQKYDRFKFHFLLAVSIMATFVIIEFILTKQRISTFKALISSIFFILAVFLIMSTLKKKFIPIGILNFLALIVGLSRFLIFSFFMSPFFYFFSKKGLSRILFISIVITTLLFTVGFAHIATNVQYSKLKREFERKHHFISLGTMDKSVNRLTDFDFLKLSLFGRGNMWHEDLKGFNSHPVLGVGIGNTRVQAASSHNLHIQLLAYTGIIGYLIFHLLLFQGMSSMTEKRTDLLIRDFHFYSTTVFLIYLNGITSGLFHGIFNYVLFMVLALMQNLRFLSTMKVKR